MAQNSQNKLHTGFTITLAAVAALMLFIANSAFWFNKYIFDQNNFTSTTSAALRQESSREAIATEITGKLLANRPVLARAAEEPITKIISGILDSNLATSAYTRVIDSLHSISTSPNPQDVTLNLVPVKQVVASVFKAFDIQAGESSVQVQDIPNTVTIVQASKVPSIYGLGVTLLWVGPLAVVTAIILLAYAIWRARSSWLNVAKVLAINSAMIALVGLLALAVGPIFKPMVLANVQSANLQVVVGNVYGAFIDTFNQQTTTWLFGIAIVLLLVACVIWTKRPISRWLNKWQNSKTPAV